jgi:hypothetical protein
METDDIAAPRTVQIITHAKVFDFVEGWNEIDEQPEVFQFGSHAFNFDYLLHLSGINYLIHPDDIYQLIQLVKRDDQKVVDYHFRFINRSGEVKHMRGAGRLVPASAVNEIDSFNF